METKKRAEWPVTYVEGAPLCRVLLEGPSRNLERLMPPGISRMQEVTVDRSIVVSKSEKAYFSPFSLTCSFPPVSMRDSRRESRASGIPVRSRCPEISWAGAGRRTIEPYAKRSLSKARQQQQQVLSSLFGQVRRMGTSFSLSRTFWSVVPLGSQNPFRRIRASCKNPALTRDGTVQSRVKNPSRGKDTVREGRIP